MTDFELTILTMRPGDVHKLYVQIDRISNQTLVKLADWSKNSLRANQAFSSSHMYKWATEERKEEKKKQLNRESQQWQKFP